MKRNKQSVRVAHLNAKGKKSKYAAKVAAKNQMYGPGCCAHRVKLSNGATYELLDTDNSDHMVGIEQEESHS